jgi:hypothetical protein
MASVVEIGGTKYLDVKLKGGCLGTTGSSGCGLEGALPLFGVGDSATLEYMCDLDFLLFERVSATWISCFLDV